MNIKKSIHSNINKFILDTSASVAPVLGVATMITFMIGGGGLDMVNAQIQVNSTASRIESLGSYASQQNSCSDKVGDKYTSCASSLNILVNSYGTKIGQASVNVIPGFWCYSTSSFSVAACTGSSTSSSAVKITGSSDYQTSVLKIVGTKDINKTIEMIFVNGDITSINTAGICPGIILDANKFSNSVHGDVDWSEQTKSPRWRAKRELRVGEEREHDFGSQIGTYKTRSPFWLFDITRQSGSPLFPKRETIDDDDDATAPIAPLRGPSGTSFDVTSGKIYKVFSNKFDADDDEFDDDKMVLDPDYGRIRRSDNGGRQLLRSLKKLEGQTCMALAGVSVGDKKDQNVKITGIYPISLEVVCDGTRRRQGKNFRALTSDGKSEERRCSYSSDSKKVEITIKYWIAEGRDSDDDDYIISDKNKWGGEKKGDSSKGSVKGMRGSPSKVADNRSKKD